MTTAELVKEYAKLKYEIEMKIFQYNKIGNELSKRFPTLQKEFKPKTFVNDNGKKRN